MPGGRRKNADGALAALLAAGKKIADAARTVGVSESLVYRRLEDASFRTKISDLQGAMVAQAVGLGCEGLATGMATLRVLCLNSKSDAVRIRAAALLMEYTIRLRDHASFEARISELERLAAEDQAEREGEVQAAAQAQYQPPPLPTAGGAS